MEKIKLLVAETSPPQLVELLSSVLIHADCEIEIFSTLIANLIPDYQFYHPHLVIIVGNEIFSTMNALKQAAPQAKVVFLVDTPHLTEGQRALKMGAMGYLARTDFLENPATLIRTASAGKILFPKELIDQLFP